MVKVSLKLKSFLFFLIFVPFGGKLLLLFGYLEILGLILRKLNIYKSPLLLLLLSTLLFSISLTLSLKLFLFGIEVLFTLLIFFAFIP